MSDRRCIAVNDAFATFFGYTRDELVGHRSDDLDFYVDPSARACIACEDMPCAAVCETGALTKVPWEQVHMGILELDPQRCITFQGAECGVCARACPIGERALALDDRGHPVLKPEGCVGCGVCVTACVTVPSSLKLRLA